MKRTLIIFLVFGLLGFTKESISYEKIAFDYFISDILPDDFDNISAVRFKGETEDRFSTLGKYKFCLQPEEKLDYIINQVTRGSRRKVKQIQLQKNDEIEIVDYMSKAKISKLLLYPSLHIAGKYYVFLLFQMPDNKKIKYVFELTPEGEISRTCKME